MPYLNNLISSTRNLLREYIVDFSVGHHMILHDLLFLPRHVKVSPTQLINTLISFLHPLMYYQVHHSISLSNLVHNFSYNCVNTL